jgi:hypothetical protein
MWEVTALSLNMGFSGFLRWFGQFAKRKVTWLWRNSNHGSSSQVAILINPFYELHETRFSHFTDMHPVDHNITRFCTFLQFVKIVTKHFLHDPAVCHNCHKILPAQSCSLSQLSQNTSCTILQFVTIVTKYLF